MNSILKDILSKLRMSNKEELIQEDYSSMHLFEDAVDKSDLNATAKDILKHWGVERRSGRYPWGSGDNPYQHSGDFLSRIEELEKNGWKATPENIDSEFGLTVEEFRMSRRRAKIDRRNLEVDRVKSLQEDGLNATEIAVKMYGDKSKESTVRSLLDEERNRRNNLPLKTAEILKQELDEKGIIDVGKGVEHTLGVTRSTLKEAVYILEAEYGIERFGIGVANVTNAGKKTTIEVIAKPGTDEQYVREHQYEIENVGQFHSADGGNTWKEVKYPASISSDRVGVRFDEDGGTLKDGVIEIRPGVKDLDMGNSHYAQVRILVDGTHYAKGMAVYASDSDAWPDGVDIMVNSNKSQSKGKMGALKSIKDDPKNPFGAYISADGQTEYIDDDGTTKLSPINKIKWEGEWDTQARNLSSQFLSKQPMTLINRQLNLTYADYADEYKDICDLKNPTIKRKLLLDFAGSCDTAVTHLKASMLPGQRTRVILPCDSLSDKEVYAPDLENGTQVALIRYPHGGTFEIPMLTVNNTNEAAIKSLGKLTDAIGINGTVAEKLSGADFDGDTVMLIPQSETVRVKSTETLKDMKVRDALTGELTNFTPGIYAIPDGNPNKVKIMSEDEKQRKMGEVSNLITDMTLKGATNSELARAVKHSMVVIDAVKHQYDYKQSEKDNGILELKSKYQSHLTENGTISTGASTLLSRRKQDVLVPERQGSGRINKETGKVEYKETGKMHYDKKGNLIPNTTKSKLLLETEDIYTLSSGTPQEEAYAKYANRMKALADEARLKYVNTPRIEYSSAAAKEYASEVSSLNAKLNQAEANAPRERRAQIIANAQVKAQILASPETYIKPSGSKDNKAIRKISQQAIEAARIQVGASGKANRISLTDDEWDAIQAGAISDSKAERIFKYCEDGAVRERAMPKEQTTISDAKQSRIRAMQASGYTIAEIADQLSLSASTVTKYINS